MCVLCLWLTCLASWREIPGEIGSVTGIGRLSNARLRSSGVMFIQSGMTVKNSAMASGPDSAVGILLGNCQGGVSWPMYSRRSSVHFDFFISIPWRRKRNDWSYWKSYIGIDMVYDIRYDVEDAPKRFSLLLRYPGFVFRCSLPRLCYWCKYVRWPGSWARGHWLILWGHSLRLADWSLGITWGHAMKLAHKQQAFIIPGDFRHFI